MPLTAASRNRFRRYDEEITLKEPFRFGRFVVTIVVLFLVFMFVQALVTSDKMYWPKVFSYLLDERVLNGLTITLQLTLISAFIGIVGGTVLASLRLSRSRLLRAASGLYIWIMRGTPLLVQLLFFYFLAALFPRLGVGIPYGTTFLSWDTNVLITPFVAAILAFGLNEAAYMAEIVRAGLISVPEGQVEAAASLGLSEFQVFRTIVLPQAMRVIIPPMVNQLIKLLKETSIVLMVAIPDLLTSVQVIYNQNFMQIPLLTVASFWYLLITTLLTVAQSLIEKRFARGFTRNRPVQQGDATDAEPERPQAPEVLSHD